MLKKEEFVLKFCFITKSLSISKHFQRHLSLLKFLLVLFIEYLDQIRYVFKKKKTLQRLSSSLHVTKYLYRLNFLTPSVLFLRAQTKF